MSIKQFYSSAQQRDFARQFQFRLRSFGNVLFNEPDFVYVETASLPGRAITNVAVPYMGLSFNVPGSVTYPGSAGYNVSFRCDQNYNIRAALEAATFNTFDENNSTGDYNIPLNNQSMTLELLGKAVNGEEPNVVRTYTMFGVYVVSLADAAYDIKDTGSIQTVAATLAYQFWRSSPGAFDVQDTDEVDPIGWAGDFNRKAEVESSTVY